MKKISTLTFAFSKKSWLCSWGGLVATLLLASSTWGQSVIRFQATDVLDTVPGEDMWEYSYSLENLSFEANQGFSVFFDHRFYSQLQNARPSLSPAWDVMTVQRDIILEQPGYFDALALMNLPPINVLFAVNFVWMGEGMPGIQPFTLYTLEGPNLTTTYSDFTAVPEPATWMLASLGGLAWWGWKRRASK